MPGWAQQLPLVPCDLAFGPLDSCCIIRFPSLFLSSRQAPSGFDDLRTKDREFLPYLHLELSSCLCINEPSLDIPSSATQLLYNPSFLRAIPNLTRRTPGADRAIPTMNIGNPLYSIVNKLRDTYTPVSNTSTFRKTGQITPEEFLAAGDYLVFKFPTWSWADADPSSKRVNYLPAGKQFLVTRNVPCHRRLDADFAGDAGHEEALVNDGDDFQGQKGGDEDGWLRTGGLSSSQPLKVREIRTVDDAGNVGDGQVVEDDDDIPDMEDEDDDEAIIRDVEGDGLNRYVCATEPLVGTLAD